MILSLHIDHYEILWKLIGMTINLVNVIFDYIFSNYLPPLPGDADTVLANAILFDGIVQIRLEDLLMSTRHASLSLVGWRIFGSLVRTIMVRAGESEVKMRTSLQTKTE